MKNLKQFLNSFSTDNVLFLTCAILIVIYVAIATPRNTPSFFSHPLVKAGIFVLILYVCQQNVHLGVAFGLSMVLTLCYAHLQSQTRSIDGFVDFNTKAIDDIMDKITTTVPSLTNGTPQQPVVEEEQQQQSPLHESFGEDGLEFQPLESSLQASEFIS